MDDPFLFWRALSNALRGFVRQTTDLEGKELQARRNFYHAIRFHFEIGFVSNQYLTRLSQLLEPAVIPD